MGDGKSDNNKCDRGKREKNEALGAQTSQKWATEQYRL